MSLTQKLVRTPSTSPPGNVSAVALVAADQIRQLIPESDISTTKTGPGVINVVAVIRSGCRGKRLVFSGHLDTYPTGDVGRWTLDPFSGELSSDGKHVYGRGVSDMKGGIAASIIAAQVPKLPVVARRAGRGALAGDEETMGKLGSAHLIKHVAEAGEADAMICGDAGSLIIVPTGEKGRLWLEVEANGKAAHGAHVHRGSNAIDRLLAALSQLKYLEKLEIWPVKEVEDAIAAAMPVSESLGGPGEAAVLGSITVNIGTISGGTSTNLVAQTASASLDIRLPMGLSTATLIEQIKRILCRAGRWDKTRYCAGLRSVMDATRRGDYYTARVGGDKADGGRTGHGEYASRGF
ncbi:hypothetical protein MY4824_009101 [Beauveria thailandica]